MDEGTLRYYDENAATLAGWYRETDVAHLHEILRRWLQPGQRVFEIGCGCGRDAAFMADLGCDVLATDASKGMLSAVPKDWSRIASYRQAAFPLRPDDPLLGRRFDAVVAIATMMHVPDGDLLAFLSQVRTLLTDRGVFICSVCPTHPCANDDPRLYVERDPLQLQLLLKRIGLRMVAMDSCPDNCGRHIEWTTQVFVRAREPENEALIQLAEMLTREKHTATYKAAFIRALCDISLEYHGHSQRNAQNDISIPLGLVVEKWIHYYWPLVDSAYELPEMRAGPFGGKLAFRDSLRRLIKACQPGGLAAFSSAYKTDSLSPEQGDALSELAARVADAIVRGPVTHIGGSERRTGQTFTHDGHVIRRRCGTRQELLDNFGNLLIPSHIWREIGVSSYWVREASILHWAKLSCTFAKDGVLIDGVLERLKTGPLTLTYDAAPSAPAEAVNDSHGVTNAGFQDSELSRVGYDAPYFATRTETPPTASSVSGVSEPAPSPLVEVESCDRAAFNHAALEDEDMHDSASHEDVAPSCSAPMRRELESDARPCTKVPLTLAAILGINHDDLQLLSALSLSDLYLTPGLRIKLAYAGVKEVERLLTLPVSVLLGRGHVDRMRLRHICCRLSEAGQPQGVTVTVPIESDWESLLDGKSLHLDVVAPVAIAAQVPNVDGFAADATVKSAGAESARWKESSASADTNADLIISTCDDSEQSGAARFTVEASPEEPVRQSDLLASLEPKAMDSAGDMPDATGLAPHGERDEPPETTESETLRASEKVGKASDSATLAGLLGMSAQDVDKLASLTLDDLQLTSSLHQVLADAGLYRADGLLGRRVWALLDSRRIGHEELRDVCGKLLYFGRFRDVCVTLPDRETWESALDAVVSMNNLNASSDDDSGPLRGWGAGVDNSSGKRVPITPPSDDGTISCQSPQEREPIDALSPAFRTDDSRLGGGHLHSVGVEHDAPPDYQIDSLSPSLSGIENVRHCDYSVSFEEPQNEPFRAPLIDCFQLSELERDRVRDIASHSDLGLLGLDDYDWGSLGSAALTRRDTVLDVLSVSPTLLSQYFRSAGAFNRTMHSVISFVRTAAGRQVELSVLDGLSDRCPVQLGDFDHSCELVISERDVSTRLVTRARAVGFATWGQAQCVTERAVVAEHGLSWLGVEKLQVLQLLDIEGRSVAEENRQFRAREAPDLGTLLEPELLSCSRDSRNLAIIVARLGLNGSNPATLQEIASRYNITRERIRQIEIKFLDRRTMPKCELRLIRPFWLVIESILAANYGVMSVATLSAALARWLHLTVPPAPQGVVQLLAFASAELGIEIRERGGHTQVVTTTRPCADCGAVVDALSEFMAQRESASMDSACNQIRDRCRAMCPHRVHHETADPKELVRYLVFGSATTRQPLYLVDDMVSRVEPSVSPRRKPVTLAVLGVLESGPGPWRVRDICATLVGQGFSQAAISPHQVTALLARQSEIMQWDRSVFVHSKFIQVSSQLLTDIETWLVARLQAGEVAISIRAARISFERECGQCGLTTDFSVYSALRSHSKVLSFPKYPQVTLPSRRARVSIESLVEDYVLAAHAPVPLGQIRDHFMSHLGLKSFQLSQALTRNRHLLKIDRCQYVHATVVLDSKPDIARTVQSLARHALRLMEEGQVVTVPALLDRYMVDCQVSGIGTSQLLASLLELLASDLVRIHGSSILRPAGDSTKQDISLRRLLCDRSRDENRPITIEELARQFVGEMGYSEAAFRQALSAREIVRYTPDAVVHTSTIGWDASKSSELEDVALGMYEDALRSGKVFAEVASLIESPALPTLGNELVYTPTCLGELLSRCGKILTLGDSKRVFVSSANVAGVDGFEGLVRVIVRSEFRGGCTVIQLEEYLLRHGIVASHLPRRFFDSTTGITKVGEDIFVAGIDNHA